MLSKDELPAMTGAEMRAQREFLGLSINYLAKLFVMEPRRVARMEEGSVPIPDAVVTYLDELSAYTKDIVHRKVAQYRRQVKSSPYRAPALVQTYFDGNVDYTFQGGELPASWHRMTMQRVAEAVPGVILTYDADTEGNPCVLPPGMARRGKIINREDDAIAHGAGQGVAEVEEAPIFSGH